MGQKVHPRAFRLGVIGSWNAKWFAGRNYSRLLREDVTIRSYLNKRLRDAGIAGVEIERSSNGLIVTVHTSRPGMVIGRGGAGADKLKQELLRLIASGQKKTNLKLNIQEVQNPDQNAQVVVRSVVDQIEKRLPFRRVLKHTVDQVMRSGALGVKVMLAGRLNGAEIARTEKLSRGTIPLQTLRADVDFGRGAAHTTYGQIGVKVWIYRGQVFAVQARKT